MTYLEMMQVAAEAMNGRTIPIVQVPVLTPRLSSYWLALVTDVDVTTGRNLIDSMATEVVVTDTSIRDVVPGEPLGYAESVRRARGRAGSDASRASAEEQRQHEQHRQRPGAWVMIGARIPPLARRWRPTTIPMSTAAKASITLPVASVASEVGDRRARARGSAGPRRTPPRGRTAPR